MAGRRWVVELMVRGPLPVLVVGVGECLGAACLDALPRVEAEGVNRPWHALAGYAALDGLMQAFPLLLSEFTALALSERRRLALVADRATELRSRVQGPTS